MMFFYARVNAEDTTFISAYERDDWGVLSAECIHSEGEFPILTLEVKNPYTGLILSGSPLWMWMAWRNPNTDHVEELFFGRLIGQPKHISREVIEVQYMARSVHWLLLKQALAESLKVVPYYDPIFVDPTRRDDPDTVLEGRSALFHWPRFPTGAPAEFNVTISDYLDAEDGTEVFLANETTYDDFEMDFGQQPLTVVYMKSQVHWTQQAAGTITGFGNKIPSHVKYGNANFTTTVSLDTLGVFCWTGGSLIDDWPKPGAQLAGGYLVAAASAIGNGAQYGQPCSHHYSWQNTEKQHINGDAMSQNASWTTYPCGGDVHRFNVVTQSGAVDPGQTGGMFDPSIPDTSQTYDFSDTNQGINIPLHISYSETMVAEWIAFCTLSLNYEAIRPRTEFLEFKLTSDLQPILTDPNEPASLDTETVTVSGCDVSAPLQNVLSWYSVKLAGSVPIGTIVSSTVEFVGPTVYSIAVIGGTVGTTEPSWSDVLGETVVDGSVTWASLGTSLPSDYSNWQGVEHSTVQLGTVIKAYNYLPSAVDRTGIPIPAPAGTIQSFQLCTQEGVTQQYTNSLGTGISDLNPGHPEPVFSATPGVVTNDGTAKWTSLGDGGGVINIPIGLDLSKRSFFPADRGQESIRYLINVARARLRLRSRCVQARFACKFERAIQLSCRIGAVLQDHRAPNGEVQGKVISYSFSVNKEGVGVIIGHVTIAGSVGKGGTPTTDPGQPSYIDDDYIESDYQVYSDAIIIVSDDDVDVAYTPPVDAPNDDGIVFPITDKSQIVVKEMMITGTPPGAAQYLPNNFHVWQENINMPGNGVPGSNSVYTIVKYIDIPNGFAPVEIPVDQKQILPFWGAVPQTGFTQVFVYPITQYYLELKPLQGMSFSDQYNLTTTQLNIPKMVDLS